MKKLPCCLAWPVRYSIHAKLQCILFLDALFRFEDKAGKPTLILEAVATHDLRFWHVFFGCPGTDNDINVLNWSPPLADYVNGIKEPLFFYLNGKVHTQGMCHK